MNERRTARIVALVMSVLALAWAGVLLIFGGFEFRLVGVSVTTNEPLRPLAVFAVAFAVFVWSFGTERAEAVWTAAIACVRHVWIAAALALATLIVGVFYSTNAAIASDSYGYVSQADLWLRGTLKIPQPWAEHVPWPSKGLSFAPLAYRAVESDGHWTNVPIYSPGLPLLMAAAKAIGGQSALFLIVPFLGSLMILATWGLGCRFGSSSAGLIAAWLVATSPIFLHMLMQPMSDVAAAAAWTAGFYFLLGPRPRSSFAAGVAAGVGLMIRPNLVYIAAIMNLWPVLRPLPPDARRARAMHVVGFAAPVMTACAAVALIFDHLWGSPFTSGYGTFTERLDSRNVAANAVNYLGWLVGTQTTLALAGLAVVLAPIRRVWPWARDRRILWLFSVIVTAVWVFYFTYTVYDEWLFLRFLLPTWPLLMLGFAAVVLALTRLERPALTLAMAGLVIGLGVRDLRVAAIHGAFDVWRSDRRAVSVASLVREGTGPSSVMLSMNHSGTLRYYGGRMTIRFDQLEADWLDRAVQWLDARGVHCYAVLEEWEVDLVRQRFAGQQLVDRLDRPLMIYRGTDTVLVFDLSAPLPAQAGPQVYSDTYKPARLVAQPVPDPVLSVAP